MRLQVTLGDYGVHATLELYDQAAPNVTRAIYQSLETPLQTRTSHACFDGHEVFCFLPPFPQAPPLENRTFRPTLGEVMFFYAPINAFACLSEHRMAPGGAAMHELAFVYGDVDLRHFDEEGLHGSLVGRITEGIDQFASACEQTLVSGSTAITISRPRP